MEKNKSFFGTMAQRINEAIGAKNEVDEELLEQMEEILITSDIGMDTTERIMDRLNGIIQRENITKAKSIEIILKKIMINLVDKGDRHAMAENMPLVVLIIGINGGGKTTTIGKLGYHYAQQGKQVLFAAADTFRAAAAKQLELWGERVGVPVVSHQEGADPSAVLYDAISAAKARNVDVLICDTAGRLQNKKNLMKELEKMNKVIERECPEAQRETLLVLDATTGKNALSQTKEFGQVTDLSGVIITKLDGTAKGGIAVTVADEFDMPIKFVGLGEKMEDLRLFDSEEFLGGIFDE